MCITMTVMSKEQPVIDLLPLSLHLSRQISTYDADFTLLPECDLLRALDCLSKTFSISNNPLEDAGLEPTELQSWDDTFPTCASSEFSIGSLKEALLVGAATTRGRQSSVTTMGAFNAEQDSRDQGQRQDRGYENQDKDDKGYSRHHRSRRNHHHHQHHRKTSESDVGLGHDDQDSGIGSESNSGPSSGLNSGHGSHVLDTTIQGLDPALLSSLSLQDGIRATRARPPFQANSPHRLHVTSMEHGLMDQLAIRLLESIFFDKR